MGAFGGPPSAVSIQRRFGKNGIIDPADVEKLLSYRKGVTPENRRSLLTMLDHVRATDGVWKEPFVPW